MIIAEYTLDHTILRQTLGAVPGITVTWETSHTGPDGRPRFIAWVAYEDFDRADEAFREDPSVANPTVLTETDERRLYRFDLVGDAVETDILPLLVEVGGVQRKVEATSDGWLNRTQFPDRAAFERVYTFCADNDIDFTFHRIWERTEGYEPTAAGLTDPQREILRAAVERGYLDVPRRRSLADLADDLGISESAASERFRRAARNLVSTTVL